MKTTKKILAVVLALAMLVPMGLVSFAAHDAHDVYQGDNWTSFAAKFSKSTNAIIAPKSGGIPVIKTAGFNFEDNEDNSIKVETPDYATFAGVYGTSALTSKYATELDGLNVVIQPDAFKFDVDNIGSSNQFSVLWTENPIKKLADPVNKTGLADAISASSNGLRHIIEIPENVVEGKASTSSSATNPTGKALCINISNEYSEYDDTQTASTVSIVYYDGYYVNSVDHHPGYRWTFTARNSSQTPKGDKSGIVKLYEEIDISEGLNISVRADDTLGYIVTINGKDYYKGEEVAYFPEASVNKTKNNGLGNSIDPALTDSDYIDKTDKYKNSLEYAKADINLSGLKTVSKGYLTIGAVSNGVTSNHDCNYTLVSVNGKAAATWKGETSCKHLNCTAWQTTKPASCKSKGSETCTCLDCQQVLTRSIDKLAHKYTDWTLDSAATCVKKGQEKRSCTECLQNFYRDIDKLPHNMSKVDRVEPTYSKTGNIEYYTCSQCKLYYKDISGNVAITEAQIILDKKPLPFTDVPAGWYYDSVAYCVDAGLFSGMSETTFAPMNKLTREQFMQVLFNFAGQKKDDWQGPTGFDDVAEGKWYSPAIKWAGETGITSGLGPGRFGLTVQITREQFAVLLMNYAGQIGKDTSARADISAYTDTGDISSWAVDGIRWAVAEELMSGTSATNLSPKTVANRATATRLFMNFDIFCQKDPE